MKPVYYKYVVLAAILSLACTTRVSEWVLLNSLPNQYTLVCYYNGTVNEPLAKQNREIAESIKQANIRFKTVPVHDVNKPFYELFYNNRSFSKYETPAMLKGLTSSPVREKVASELLAGKLCVMVYLKSGNKEKDDKGYLTLKKTVDSSPFRDIIPVIELTRNNLDEAHFVSFLINVEDDLKTINEPMLFGVFGRFKALEPLLGRGITEENINLMIDYLTAECSCLIKDDLPGTDILFTNNWDNPQPALLNKIIDANTLPGQ
jgi:hypothetical protein